MFTLHVKARGSHPQYPARFHVPDEKVDFMKSFHEYKPTKYTAQVVIDNDETKKAGGWAHAEDHMLVDWTKVTTHENKGKLLFGILYDSNIQHGVPFNPQGRTGMAGRGLLGKWGPNHAADPVVTRFHNGKHQMVAIKRKDTGEWAIPGGMVDAGEQVSATLRREFEEEAGNVPADQKEQFKKDLDELFKNGETIYKGYVDDPRNTDNAWMETVVVHFGCPYELGQRLKLHAGDDAAQVKWLDIDDNNLEYKNLYASHKNFVDAAILVMNNDNMEYKLQHVSHRNSIMQSNNANL